MTIASALVVLLVAGILTVGWMQQLARFKKARRRVAVKSRAAPWRKPGG